MQIDVTNFHDEYINNSRLGQQSMKIIEIIEKLDERRREYLQIHFVNQWEEHHYEKFYPDRHSRKLYEIASAIGSDCFHKDKGNIIIDTSQIIGGFIHCILTNVEMKNGEITDTAYIRMIRASHRRKDTTGSWNFKKVRQKKVIK